MIIIGIEALELSKADQKRLLSPHVSGVIFFSRNYESPTQLKALTKSIKALAPTLPLMVDQEGGRVMRFREGFSPLPPLQYFGDLWEEQGPELACAQAQSTAALMAKELRDCGMDSSLSPVVDLGWNQEIIGNRAFHTDPHIVTVLAQAWIAGMRQSGMKSVLKHFPGHGSIKGDTHIAKLQDERSLQEIEMTDLQPFSTLISTGQADAVMMSHVVYPAVDHRAASFSSEWIQTILKKQLGFQGKILSDDLGMQAAKATHDPLQPVVLALEAGCDQVLLCNEFEVMNEVLFSSLEFKHVSKFDSK